MHAYRLVDLALQAPAIRLAWVAPSTTAARLVRPGNAVYHYAHRTAIGPGIATIEDVARMLHEIGTGAPRGPSAAGSGTNRPPGHSPARTCFCGTPRATG